MVDDLLQLTRLESGLMSFRPEPVDVRPFVQDAIDRIARVSENGASAAIRNLVPADLAPMEVDREHLERALGNLLDNALRYTPSTGEVSVQAAAEPAGWVEISVSDNGSGIRRQDLPRIFERFYRSGKSRERGHGHSGLGLAIVREIVEAHGGRINVSSREGKGTTFRFTVPALDRGEVRQEFTVPGESVQRPAAR